MTPLQSAMPSGLLIMPDGRADYNLRRNKCDAARVLLSLKTQMLKELRWKP